MGALILNVAAVTSVCFMILVLKDASLDLHYDLRNCDMQYLGPWFSDVQRSLT